MTDWLYDTLLWTGALIGLVLILRRPVARFFGPRIAYALWCIPFIRLILPPVVLPASMAPEIAPVAGLPAGNSAAIDPATLMLAEQTIRAETAPQSAASALLDPAALTAVTLALWLGGAAVFIALRFKGYRKMREELLAKARQVGTAGQVRLVETPAATSPLAFGVIDKVVALPPGFMAMHDRETRDLAVAHELAHHQGRDLLVNLVMQPLFALHWFNPLGYYGWQALRRDQESACDARVIENRPEEKRAEYARVIASFAAGPNVALAAPMACPVLGEKSIIERLRSLKMNRNTSKRRKAGGALLAGALIALPLTATVSYAESQSVEEAFAEESMTPPAPPSPPQAPTPPDAPLPPEPPMPPEAPDIDVDVDVDGGDRVWRSVEENELEDGTTGRVEKVYVIKGGEGLSVEERREIELEVEEARREAKQARAEARREMRTALAESVDVRAEAERVLKEVKLELESGEGGHTIVEMKCEGDEIASQKTRSDGTNVVMICKSKVMAEALKGLKEARAAIASNSEMDAETRKEALRAIDEQIKNWNS